MAATTTHKAMTAHVRDRLRHGGIAASVRMVSIQGETVIQVNTPSYDARFTPEQSATIALIADVNGLRGVRGDKIAPVGQTFNLYMPTVGQPGVPPIETAS